MNVKKKGSALLVVLGMVSFMIVSAVSFAIYMRQSRAPSSYVRRNVAARQIVKAALARAIDEIDTAIGNDPFPGVGKNAKTSIAGGTVDRWPGRVFTPSNEVPSSTTVSTLSLEGLGYLPPPLINEVRHGSRHTITAQWKSFNYDLGRYAFTAVNVSDYFDINTVKANQPRTSHDPVSLSALFMNDSYSDFAVTPSDWDSKVSTALGTTEPLNRFFSLMDYNLVLRGNAWGTLKSPFWNILNGSTSGGSVYSGMQTNDLCRQVFVTDSYFPASEVNDTRIDLMRKEHQPFEGLSGFPQNTQLRQVIEYGEGKPFWNAIDTRISYMSQVALADYLDYDSVPLMLCGPTMELAPMIMGVEFAGGVNYSIEAPDSDAAVDVANLNAGAQVEFSRTYKLKVSADPNVSVSVVFPFRRASDRLASKSFTVELYGRLFFTPGSDVPLRYTGNGGFANLINGSTWRTGTTPQLAADKSGIELFATGNVTIDPNVETANDVYNGIKTVPLTFRSGEVSVDLLTQPYVTEVIQPNPEDISSKKPAFWDDQKEKTTAGAAVAGMPFFEANWSTIAGLTGENGAGAGGVEMRPSFAFWIRLKDANGDTVDCVPAVPAFEQLNNNTYSDSQFNRASGASSGTPLLRFSANTTAGGFVKLDKSWIKASKTILQTTDQWAQQTYVACDPRYNWAPEDWIAYATATDPKTAWKTIVEGYLGKSGRDADVFMSVSDRGYMQSMYEWLFVPQVKPFGSGDPMFGSMIGAGYDGKVRTEGQTLANDTLMWRTFRCDAFDASDWGSIDELSFVTGGSSFRVNPFGDGSTLKAAFVNTPYDWWAAASNHLSTAANRPSGDKTFTSVQSALKYAFCPSSNDGASQWSRQDISALLGGFTAQMSGYMNQHPESSWTNAFDSLNWYPYNGVNYNGTEKDVSQTSLFDTQADPLYEMHEDITSVDRKYLYGFWKGCFQNDQQLFLVFVRAEPVSQGGSDGTGGARAVALVWRDPNPPSGYENTDNANNYLQHNNRDPVEAWRLKNRQAPPHRTRVLFYRQFD